jgi:NHL repeat
MRDVTAKRGVNWRMRASALAIAAGLSAAGMAPAQTISTVAGTLAPGFSGDGGAAISAQLDRPFSVAVDGSGHVFIADQIYNVIRQFTVGGTISTVAGMPGITGGFGGDGGAATGAAFSGPAGIAVDASGRVFVADAGNRRIRMFTPGGTISTVAGGGSSAGNDGLGDGGPAVSANLAYPQGVAVDASGNVFVADTYDHLVREFAVGGTISVVAGTPNRSGYGGDGGAATSALLSSPAAVAVDGAGHVYVADNGSHVIREFTVGGTISTVAGTPQKPGYSGDGGPATAALLHGPSGVSVGGAGNLYIADTENGVIRLVAPGGVITTMAGGGSNPGSDGVGDGGPAPLAGLSSPATVVPDGKGNLLVADTGNDLIRSLSATLPAPSLFAAVLPGARSVQATGVATIFATVLNASGTGLSNCQVALPSATPRLLQLDYQTTDPSSNALTGSPDTPASIAANGSQTFLLSFSNTENTGTLFADPGQQLLFACDTVDPAATTQGVDTVDLSFSPKPVADIIALAAVAGTPGTLDLPANGAGAFAVASDNVGSADTLTVSVDTGSATLPLALAICPTNASAQCTATPAPSLSQSFAAGSAPTFSVFASATAPIAFAPATSRIFVRFKDSSGASHGSTSVAVETH